MMSSTEIVIGSRGSQLALWQANWVKLQLEGLGTTAEIRVIRTSGDRLPEAPLDRSGTKGLFIKEIEEALVAGEIDVAVHSLKDLPTVQPPGLIIGAVPKREDPRDVFMSRTGVGFNEIGSGARVGTSSLRRQAQIRHLRIDLSPVAIRGNLDTRLKKLERGHYDALVLAAAGLHRLGLASRIQGYFTVEQICPAAGQGALALEVREADTRILRWIERFDDASTHAAVRSERAALATLGGGCQTSMAVYAYTAGPVLNALGVVASPDGGRIVRATASGTTDDPVAVGARLSAELMKQGAAAVLETMAK